MPERWLFLIFVAMGATVLAQDAFEVASVRRNTSGQARMSFGFEPGGRLVMVNAPVRMLLLQAYLVPGSRIVGGPAWVDTERYDVTAKAETDAPAARLRLMARALLADRFKLTAHFEDREQQTFALVVARPGALGPRLRKTDVDCAPRGACRTSHETNTGTLTSGGMTMMALAVSLSLALETVITDETGLTGNYEVSLAYAPERSRLATRAPDADFGERPSLVTAVQEQLGLKLESRRGPVPVLVIDRIERPVDD